MRSIPPSTAPRCSISKRKATATAGSATRPSRYWNAASPLAGLEGGVSRRYAYCQRSQAALNYAIQNVTGLGTNIVSVPQLYGTTHTLFAHIFPRQGVTVKFAGSDRAEADVDMLID